MADDLMADDLMTVVEMTLAERNCEQLEQRFAVSPPGVSDGCWSCRDEGDAFDADAGVYGLVTCRQVQVEKNGVSSQKFAQVANNH